MSQRVAGSLWLSDGVTQGELGIVFSLLELADTHSGACLALSLAQRALSRRARHLRRNARTVSGRIEFENGRTEDISASYLLGPPEAALKLMGVAVTLLALGLLVARL